MNKDVKLLSMTLRNFKGIKDLTVEFGQVTDIYGANATGKSTINDAFTWVLFGKDAQGNSDTKFSIKTVGPDGKPYEKLEHEVTVVLDVNGERIELRRALVEDWVKPRGSAEVTLKGNHTEYFCNGVEIKAGAYKEKVDSIVEEQLFKLITNPFYFAGLDWSTQRDILLRIAGGVTYEEVAASRADFTAILTQLSGKDVVAFKQEIAYRKKKIQEGLDKIPVEINAISSVTPEAPDYEALENEKTRLTSELEEVDTTISDIVKANRQHYESVQGKRKDINDRRTKQQDILFAAKQAAQKAVFEKNAKGNTARNNYDSTKRELNSYTTTSEGELNNIRRSIASNNTAIENLKVKVDAKRDEWYKRNEDTYTVSSEGLTCPIYKTLCSDASVLKLNSEAITKAKRAFEDAKEKDLERISKEGSELNGQIEGLEKRALELAKELEDRTAEIEVKKGEYNNALGVLAKEIEANPVIDASAVSDIKGEDLPEWKELEDQISQITETIKELPAADNSELTAKKTGIIKDLDEVKRKLSLRSVIDNNSKKIAELSYREKELAQQKADLEKQEFTIDELNKARMDEVERRVNQKFQLVRFRMFEPQLNGGEKPDCVAMVNGVKFTDLNNAGKINAGLDIINTLCLFHEISAPIFVDNAESVNQLFPVGSQLVKLVVTTDKELQITKY
jgi:DNA repair exonuclease SbcCD ATPase subunit